MCMPLQRACLASLSVFSSCYKVCSQSVLRALQHKVTSLAHMPSCVKKKRNANNQGHEKRMREWDFPKGITTTDIIHPFITQVFFPLGQNSTDTTQVCSTDAVQTDRQTDRQTDTQTDAVQTPHRSASRIHANHTRLHCARNVTYTQHTAHARLNKSNRQRTPTC